MAARGARTTPLRLRRAVGVLHHIEQVVTHPTHFVHRHVLTLTEDAGLARKTDVERLRAKIFTKLQVLKQSHSLSAPIIPWPPALRPLGEWTDGKFPITSRLNSARLNDTAAGKANKTGF